MQRLVAVGHEVDQPGQAQLRSAIEAWGVGENPGQAVDLAVSSPSRRWPAASLSTKCQRLCRERSGKTGQRRRRGLVIVVEAGSRRMSSGQVEASRKAPQALSS